MQASRADLIGVGRDEPEPDLRLVTRHERAAGLREDLPLEQPGPEGRHRWTRRRPRRSPLPDVRPPRYVIAGSGPWRPGSAQPRYAMAIVHEALPDDGQGVAARARDLGAVVTVVDLDPVRLVQAQHDGCRVAEMAAALGSASVVVTATGFDGVLGDPQLRRSPTARSSSTLATVIARSTSTGSTVIRTPRLRRHLERFVSTSARVPAQSGHDMPLASVRPPSATAFPIGATAGYCARTFERGASGGTDGNH